MKPVTYDMSYMTRDRWEIDRDTVMLQQLLGEGMYGQVWQGMSSVLFHLYCSIVSLPVYNLCSCPVNILEGSHGQVKLKSNL